MIRPSTGFFYPLLCIVLFGYIVVRAIYVPLVHDEVATYVHYVHVQEFIPGSSMVDANNHLLNSGLSILFDQLLDTSPFSLRLANILSFVVLAFYTFKLSSGFKRGHLQWAFILSILGSHYLLEFYSLSRGYGLSIAFMFGLIYHLKAYLKSFRKMDGALLSLFLLLMLASSLSLLFVGISALGILGFSMLLNSRLKEVLLLLMIPGVIVGAGIRHSIWLNSFGAFYYGDGGGFWENTVQTLSLYLSGDSQLMPYVFMLLFLFSLWTLVIQKHKLSALIEADWIHHALLLGSLIGIFLAHLLLDANYPEDRVGLYLYPLLIGAFIHSLDFCSTERPKLIYPAFILLIFPLHFLFNMNLSHVDHWRMERVPDSFYEIMISYEEATGIPPTLSGYRTTELSYFMAAHLADREVPLLVHSGFPSHISDFLLTRYAEDNLTFKGYELMDSDEPSGNKLWKRRQPMSRVLIEQEKVIEREVRENQLLFSAEVNSDEDLALYFDISYNTETVPQKVDLVLSRIHAHGEQVDQITLPMDWRQDEEGISTRGTLFSHGRMEGTDSFTFRLENSSRAFIKDLEFSVQLFRLEDD